jgi:hypothetical protein
MNQRLETITEKAADDLKGFVRESEAEILDAMRKCAEEAAVQETPMKFKLGLSIAIDLDKNQQENVLSWSVRHKLSATSTIEDPNQIKMTIVTAN